jgi:hypothetical protein
LDGGRHAEAEACDRQSLEILDARCDQQFPHTLVCREGYAALLHLMGRGDNAAPST